LKSNNIEFYPFVHEASSTISYLLLEQSAGVAVVIDPAADFNILTGELDFTFCCEIENIIQNSKCQLQWILETHVHADHVTGAQYLKSRLGGKVAIGCRIREVQEIFSKIYNDAPDPTFDGSEFDFLLKPDEVLSFGNTKIEVIPTPGHTPACNSYLIENMLFVGDSIFMPDFGTARCDFPGGSANDLYASAQRLLGLPDSTKVFVGHDYGPGGRSIAWETTIGEQRKKNIHINSEIQLEEFVSVREARDRVLSLPQMIIPSIQINMRAGMLPQVERNGISYLKTPINHFPGIETSDE
jgi:glyoxylase-like metal-dependent hydrolase (beta-lactamase superfamily II)|tara:strand:+ start:5648 stop:6541 length:894 start_codon:yes stop_codon:yes gene_type:complete